MEFIKKFAKEISVFGLVIIVFLALLVYRNITYATYKTITSSQLESMLHENKEFVLVAAPSSDQSINGYKDVMTKFATKNRKYKIYYIAKDSNYIKKTLKQSVVTPCTFVIKNGKVKANKSGALQYYYLLDFVKQNY